MSEKLKPLFEQWQTTRECTQEYNHAWEFFCENDESNESGKYLLDCICAESEQAFTAGFQTAVQLLFGGVQS